MFMDKQTWKVYGFWILLTEAVGGLSGWLTREGTRIFNETAKQPPFSPPPVVFPIVWGILYALMGIGAARVRLSGTEKNKPINLFIIQLVVNFFWSLIFFNAGAYGFAFFWLLLLLILAAGMAYSFYRSDPLAGYLQIPYLFWLAFAAYLNLGVWYLNP